MKKKYFILIFLILSLSLCAVLHKAGELQVTDTDYPHMDIFGNIAYVGDNSYGLGIYDLSNPVSPLLINTLNLYFPVKYILMQGDISYLVSDDNQSGYRAMYILDSSDITNPVVLAQYNPQHRVFDFNVKGDYAFFSTKVEAPNTFYHYLEIANIEDPENPYFVTEYEVPHSWNSIVISNNIAYAGTSSGLYVMDVNDVNNIFQLDWLDIGNCSSAFIYNDLLTLSSSYGLTFVDNSDPSDCQVIATYAELEYQHGVINDGKIYATGYNPYISVIDISDPLQAYQIGDYIPFNQANEITVYQNFAYINNFYNSFDIIDISSPENEYLSDFHETRADLIEKTPDSSYMFLYGYGSFNYGLRFFDMQNPADPELVYTHFSYGSSYVCSALYVDQQICCSVFGCMDTSRLHFYDISNLQSDPVISTAQINYNSDYYYVDSICRRGDYIYLACPCDGLIIVDFSDIENPVQVGTYDIPGFVFDISAQDEYLYYVNIAGFYILNVFDPLQPFQAGNWESDHRAEQFVLNGDYAYLADYDDGIKVLNISDPTDPHVVNTVYLNASSCIDHDLIIRDNKLIITDIGWNEIMVFDISDPENPLPLSNCYWNRFSEDVELFGDYLYCAGGGDQFYDHGLSVLDFSAFTPVSTDDNPALPSFPVQISNYPNPFNPQTTISFSLPAADQNTDLSIYNVKGQCIRSFNINPENDKTDSESYEIIWDGTDQNGHPVSSGVYFYQLKSPHFRKSSKMLLLK